MKYRLPTAEEKSMTTTEEAKTEFDQMAHNAKAIDQLFHDRRWASLASYCRALEAYAAKQARQEYESVFGEKR
jgi:hypothetical protein